MSTTRTICVLALMLATLACSVPAPTGAETAEELRARIAKEQEEIAKLDKEIAEYQKQLTTIGAKKQTLQNQLDSLNISIKQLGVKIQATKKKMDAIELEIREIQRNIDLAEGGISTNKEAIAESIRIRDELESISIVELMLSRPTLSSFWDETAAIVMLDEALHGQIGDLESAKAALEENKHASEEKRAELVQEQATLAAQERSLAITKREQQSLLTQTKSQESSYQKLVAEKQAARDAFEKSLSDLESKLAFTLDPSKLPAAGKGVLRWPLDDVKITQYFGNTPFAQSGAYSGKGHNGIDFRASIGTPVYAALTGVVEATGNTDAVKGCYSYGKWVLIKHGNGLTTLYAHLSEIGVSTGQSVSTGSVIGYSGFTGYATGPHLHFTVYASSAVKVMRLSDSTGKITPCANAKIPVSALTGYLNPLDYL